MEENILIYLFLNLFIFVQPLIMFVPTFSYNIFVDSHQNKIIRKKSKDASITICE